MYYTLEPENNTFKSLVADLTHKCNMKCANCYIPNRQIPDMDVEKLYYFLKRLPFKTYIRLIGAEPTVRKDLPDIIRKIKSLGHHPSLTTNGLKLEDYGYVEDLWNAGLRMFLISMNGGTNDEHYKVLDSGKYASQKMKALANVFKIGGFINIGCIIAKGVNESAIGELVGLVDEYSQKYNYKFDKAWKSPCLRLKTVSPIGRFMENSSYSFEELIECIAEQVDTTKDDIKKTPCMSGTNPTVKVTSEALEHGWLTDKHTKSYMHNMQLKMGTMHLRLIDWTVSEDGVPSSDNRNRGRITENWKIAPFFEDVKLNEFGY